MKAYHYTEGNETFLRVLKDDGYDWEESISGWNLILDTITGKSYYRHRDGRQIEAY